MILYSSDTWIAAATTIHDAALTLADSVDDSDRDRYLKVAVRLGATLEAQPTRSQVLAASPYVLERSGRIRTLVEMIEEESGDDATRLRLAILLMRALAWDHTFPVPGVERIRQNRELIRYQRLLIGQRLDELRRLRASKSDP
jgi:hypothetical protein